MKEFLILLGWLSLSGGVLGLAVATVGRLSAGRLSRALCCGLWILVLLRLVVPFGVPGGLENSAPFVQLSRQVRQLKREQLLAEKWQGTQLALPQLQQPLVLAPLDASDTAPDLSADGAGGDTERAEQLPSAAQSMPQQLQTIPKDEKGTAAEFPAMVVPVLFWLWVSVVLFRVLWLLASYIRFRRQLLHSAVPASLEDRILFAGMYGGERLRLVRSPEASAAMVLGLAAPVIVLPAGEVPLWGTASGAAAENSTGRNAAVLRHELTHYLRGDLWLKWAAALVECIYWFNPLVWWITRQISHACELACDEAVIRTMAEEEKMQYGDMLIACAGRQRCTVVPVTAICEEKQRLQERLVNIMKYKKRNLWSVIAGVCLLALLCGCAAAMGPVDTTVTTGGEAVIDTEHLQKASVNVVTPELPTDLSVRKEIVLCGDRLWMLATEAGEQEKGGYALISVAPDGSDVQVTESAMLSFADEQKAEDELCLCLPEKLVDCGEAQPRVLWAHIHYGDNGASSQTFWEYRLSSIDAQGNTVPGIVLPVELAQSEYLLCCGTSPGVLWMKKMSFGSDAATQQLLKGYSVADGKLVYDIALPENTDIQSIQALTDDRLALHTCKTTPTENGYKMEPKNSGLYIVDLLDSQPVVGEALTFPSEFLSYYHFMLLPHPVQQLSDDVVLLRADGLYRWEITGEKLVQQYDWASAGVSFSNDFAVADGRLALPDGRIISLQQQAVGEPWRLLTITPAGQTDETADTGTVITVGGYTEKLAFDIQSMIADFNMGHPDVCVKLLDYSDAAGQAAGLASGMALLARDVIQGEGPDVLILPDGVSANDLIRHGALVDLYPLLDADEELSREDLLPNLLQLMEKEGTLPAVAPGFSVITAVANEKIVGPELGWTYEEFDAAVAKTGSVTPVNGYLGRGTELWWQLQNGGTSFIDHAVGKAYLDSPQFVSLLENLADYPEEMYLQLNVDPKESYSTGEILLHYTPLNQFKQMRLLSYEFDNAVVFKGYPNTVGNNGSMFSCSHRIGINKNSRDPQLAWQFLRLFFLPEYQNRLWASENWTEHTFPVHLKSLAGMAAAEQKPDGRLIGYPGYLGEASRRPAEQIEYWKRGITDDEVQKVMEMILSTQAIFQFDESVFAIISEEAEAFFAGVRTAEETAQLMQNRVQTYLDEQA